MQRSRNEGVDVLIVLMSLVAEGTPQLALQLARQWQQDGLRVEVMVMQPEPLDLQAEFQAVHQNTEALRNESMNPAELKKEITQLEQEKE